MRLAFMGSPDFSVPVLQAILAAGHEVVAVYSQPARPAGRGKELRATPVAQLAQHLGIPCFTPLNFKQQSERDAFAALNLDAAVVVAYGLILPQAVLDAPRLGCFNLHGSLLPRWRGAAPIQRAVMAGDATTGVQVMQMEAGLDTGPVCATAATPIGASETAGELHDRLSLMGARLMVEALRDIAAGTAIFVPQGETGVTYAAKITPAESRIDWTRPAGEVAAHIRGLSPFPGAWFELDGVRIKALGAVSADGAGAPGTVLDDRLTVACGTGAVSLTRLQRAGKEPMTWDVFQRGARIDKGRSL